MATDKMGNDGESPFESARKAFGDTASSFAEQAGTRARDYATQGKDRAVEALDNVAGLVGDAANQVSGKLGEQYGGYIQQAADAVSRLATTLRDKDTDDLVDDARTAIRSSPAIAIAAAAAVGFLAARMVKSGLTPKAGNDMANPSSAAAPMPAGKKATSTRTAAPRAAPRKTSAPNAPLAETPIADMPATEDAAPDNPSPAV